MKTNLSLTGLLFVCIPMLLYVSPLPKILGLQYHRILQPSAYVFMGAIGALGIWTLAQWGKRIMHVSQPILFSVGIMIFILLQIPVLKVELERHFQTSRDSAPFNSMNQPLYETLKHLRNEPYGLVLAPYFESLFIPVVSAKPVYVGHRTMTIDFIPKLIETKEFFSFQWDSEKTFAFITSHNISYIIVSNYILDKLQFEERYSFLTPLWSNQAYTIYRVGFKEN